MAPAGSYTYLWSNGATSQDISNLASATYTVTVTDANSCSTSAAYVVANNVTMLSLTTTTSDADCGNSNGAIDLVVSPSGTYTFAWSNGAATEDISGLPPGTYTVTVTSSDGCTATTSASVVNQGTNFIISGTSAANTSCLSPNGSIDITVAPAGSYTYLWSNGTSNQDLVNLDGGTYTVTVTDLKMCYVEQSFTVTAQYLTPEVVLDVEPPLCDKNMGSLNIHSGKKIELKYSLDGGITFFTDTIVNEIPPGVYSLLVTDVNGCTSIETFEVPTYPTVVIQTVTFLELTEGEEKKINVTLQGLDIKDIDTVFWSSTNGLRFDDFTTESLLNPTLTIAQEETEYTLTIQYGKSCLATATIKVRLKSNIQIVAPNILAHGSPNGNSKFTIYTFNGEINEIRDLRIFDRWGNMVFNARHIEPNNTITGWDGTFQGKLVVPGVFVWFAEIEFKDKTIKPYKGDVTVIK